MIRPATETRTLHAKPTQAVDILAFVEAQEISSLYFENRYYLAPAPGDENGYAMLLETLRRTRQIGIAYVVIQARQHLAAVIPQGQALVLNTLRWASEGYPDDGNLADEEELLTARWIAHRPRQAATDGASPQDHRWQHSDAFHADVMCMNEQSSAGSDMSPVEFVAQNRDADESVEIDDCLADLLHRRAHRVHARGVRHPSLIQRHRQSPRPRSRRRRL